ncbi:MAG: copper chaperone PCu(A)C [Gammaproteobacteria bacterium]|nr:copper chaperone PCu(A)C [Gammaproteobacteria bacterium]
MRKIPIVVLLLCVSACADQGNSDIDVQNAWIAEIPPVISVTAALMTLRNNGDRPRYLIAASSPKAEKIEIHKSFVVDDLARMQQQSEVEIPAHGSVVFGSETGYHLMFYGTEPLTAGQKIPVTLEFRDGSERSVVYEVRDRRSAN